MKYDIKNYKALEKYLGLLVEWNGKLNLVAGSTVENAWDRHFVDSLQLSDIIWSKDAMIYDLGSGAGFPGMVLSAIGYKNVHVVEKLQKKCLFLNEVKKELGLDVVIENKNIKDLAVKQKGVIFVSRAFASVIKIFDIVKPFLKVSPEFILLKGERWREEVEEAAKIYDFDLETVASITSDKSMILIIKNVRMKK